SRREPVPPGEPFDRAHGGMAGGHGGARVGRFRRPPRTLRGERRRVPVRLVRVLSGCAGPPARRRRPARPYGSGGRRLRARAVRLAGGEHPPRGCRGAPRRVRAVHQVFAAAAPADAVTSQALAWRERFRSWGLDGELVAEHVHPDLASEVTRLRTAASRLLDGGVVILHYSVWSEAVDAALAASAKRILWYHNITPGSFLREFNPEIAALCDQGREALPRLRGGFDIYVADSAFNALDLRQAGIEGVVVAPLLLDIA